MRPIGVLGGTFDPIHRGHLHIAEAVRTRLGLSRVVLVPTAVPPHKAQESLAPIEHRLAMLRMALAEHPALECSDLELDPTRIAYTIDTLRALRAGPPAQAPLFILGTDALVQLPTWREGERLLREFDLVAVDRAEHPLASVLPRLDPEIRARVVELPAHGTAAELAPLRLGAGGRILHLALSPSAVSSSTIRASAARGADLTELVPLPVAQYIQRMGLYRQEGRR
jgi:nicotinate-nucleotide adenylyltransferase